jgi:hypothetical protein
MWMPDLSPNQGSPDRSRHSERWRDVQIKRLKVRGVIAIAVY